MLNIHIGKIISITDFATIVYSPLGTYTYEGKCELKINDSCVFTFESSNRISFITTYKLFSEVLVANALNLGNQDLLFISVENKDLLKEIILKFFNNEITTHAVKTVENFEHTVKSIKIGSSFGRRYKPGEDNYRTYYINIEKRYGPYINGIINCFTYDKTISYWEDLSDSDDGKGYNEYLLELKKIEKQLKKFVRQEFNETLCFESALSQEIIFLAERLNSILIQQKGDYRELWEYLFEEEYRYFDFKQLFIKLVRRLLNPPKKTGTLDS